MMVPVRNITIVVSWNSSSSLVFIFGQITLGTVGTPLSLSMSQVLSVFFFYKDGFGIWMTSKSWPVIKQRNQKSLYQLLVHLLRHICEFMWRREFFIYSWLFGVGVGGLLGSITHDFEFRIWLLFLFLNPARKVRMEGKVQGYSYTNNSFGGFMTIRWN